MDEKNQATNVEKANEKAPKGDACPHCGQPAGVKWRYLLPSGTRNQRYRCRSCSRLYAVADNSRIASFLGGMFSLLPGIYVFGHIVQAGHGSRPSVVAATAVLAIGFGVVSILCGRLTLRLVPAA
jgi:hypothetical protein